MQENININELEKSLITLKSLTEKVTRTLTNVDCLIKDNINNGSGIWDSETAGLFRVRWDILRENFPAIAQTFIQQEANLEKFIENMKKTEEV